MKDLLDKLNQEDKVGQNKLKVEKNKVLENIISVFDNIMEPYFAEHKDPNSDDFIRYAPEVYGYQINEFCNSLYPRYNDIDYISFSLGRYISALINKSKDSTIELDFSENLSWRHIAKGLENKRLVINGDLDSHNCGYMKSGEIIVNGNAGTFFAQNMVSGEIIVNGNVGGYFCYDMGGGKVTVNGNIAFIAPSALRGEIYQRGKLILRNGIYIKY